MKTVLTNSPSFTPGAAGVGTLNFSSTTGFALNRLFAVLNQTRNTIMYGATVAGKGYSFYNATTKVLTLSFDTASYSSGDSLIAIYDDPAATVGITGALPAGTNAIGTVEITNDVGNAIPVSAASLPLPTGAATNTTLTDGTQKTQVTSLPALPAGSNTIGNVGVSGAVEITNDAGNAIPISAAALPLPSGAATQTTLSTVQGLLSEVASEQTTTFSGAGQSQIFAITGSGQPQCESISAIIPASYFFGGSILIQGSLDNVTYTALSLYNTQTNTIVNQMTSFGEVYQANTSGYAFIRFAVASYSSGSAPIVFKRSASPARTASSTSVAVTSLPSLPAGSNTIGNVGVSGAVEITNDAGNAIPVSFGALPTGSNTIGNVGVTGSVEITNDAGNAIPVSGTVTVSGVATESTLSNIRTNVSEPGLENTFTFNGIPQFAVIQIAGSVAGVPVVQCQSITAIISTSWNFSGTIAIEGSVDGLAFKQLDLLNLTTGNTAATISTLGETYQFSTVGWANIRFRVLSYSSGQGQVTFRRSQAPARATSSGVASNVVVTNFPSTQAVSGTVEITNDVGNSIPVSISAGSNLIGRVQLGANAFTLQSFLLSTAPQGTTLSQPYLYKITFSVENADTGYGLEPVYAKIWFSNSSTPTVGVNVPSITLCVCDGVRIYDNYEFESSLQITALYQAYIAVTKNRSATDATSVSASVAAILYTRNN
jgi:hypothetical protein